MKVKTALCTGGCSFSILGFCLFSCNGSNSNNKLRVNVLILEYTVLTDGYVEWILEWTAVAKQ
ncbi:hypothetical protein T02_7525 [Trichinella nativa]|uniref:Uncharacterized protein n=1 Tax=Trichinella nativa TaxID=6335 RepID=A0A0V1KZV3_9BILA|nr:hypothetical protein T02_7525 [Trichinella nativa]